MEMESGEFVKLENFIFYIQFANCLHLVSYLNTVVFLFSLCSFLHIAPCYFLFFLFFLLGLLQVVHGVMDSGVFQKRVVPDF